MTSRKRTVEIDVVVDDKAASRDLKNIGDSAQKSAKGFSGLSGGMKAAAIGAGAFVATNVVSFLSDATKNALADEAAQKQLALAVENTTGATSSDIDAMARLDRPDGPRNRDRRRPTTTGPCQPHPRHWRRHRGAGVVTAWRWTSLPPEGFPSSRCRWLSPRQRIGMSGALGRIGSQDPGHRRQHPFLRGGHRQNQRHLRRRHGDNGRVLPKARWSG